MKLSKIFKKLGLKKDGKTKKGIQVQAPAHQALAASPRIVPASSPPAVADAVQDIQIPVSTPMETSQANLIVELRRTVQTLQNRILYQTATFDEEVHQLRQEIRQCVEQLRSRDQSIDRLHNRVAAHRSQIHDDNQRLNDSRIDLDNREATIRQLWHMIEHPEEYNGHVVFMEEN